MQTLVDCEIRSGFDTELTGFRCFVCGGTDGERIVSDVRDWEYGTEGKWDLVACVKCTVVSISPFPGKDVIRRAYPDNYERWTSVTQLSLPRRILRTVFDNVRERQLANIVDAADSVLEVGCGNGALLDRVRACTDGDIQGIDFSKEAVSLARRKGLTVHHGTFADFPGKSSTIDLILMIGYLEHSWSVHHDLDKAAQLLRPGGRLYGVVPNFASFDRRIFGRFWGGTHAPRHLVHFTPVTLAALIESHGFDLKSLRTVLSPTTLALSLQSWIYIRVMRKKPGQGLTYGRSKFYFALLLTSLPVYVLLSLFRVGGLMSFIAVKRV